MLESNIFKQLGLKRMSINSVCRLFRERVLQMTLQEMSNKTGANLKTISAFENGRSNNIQHLKLYVACCNSTLEETTLSINIIEACKRD